MSIAQSAVRSIKNIWSHGDEEEYERDEGDNEVEEYRPEPSRAEKPSPPTYRPTYGGHGGARRLNAPVPLPVRGREKNIYTLKPKSQDEASIAADYLKTGSAVVLNLDDLDRMIAVRIIDFMSGVCYGLDNQGHAMKLGDTIFLFTPGDFEISSDETDYGENPEFFFKDVPDQAAKAAAIEQSAPTSASAPAIERTVERTVVERPVAERIVSERPVLERPTIERPSVQRPWER